MDERTPLGDRIKQARMARGHATATDFAEALSTHGRHCPANNVFRWERGTVVPHGWLATIAAECGVSIDWLITGAGDMTRRSVAEG